MAESRLHDAPSWSSTLRWAARVGAVSAVTLTVCYLTAWAAFGTPLAFLRPADDAYYYFDVASHVVHQGTFSTDGVHATNGFHPLWMVHLLPFAVIFGAPSQGLVVSAQLLSCVYFGVAVAGIAATARRAGLTPVAAGLGALALFVPPWRAVVGAVVEGGLTLALLAWTAYTALRLRDHIDEGTARSRDAVLFGALAGLTVLARLDTVWVVGAVCLATVVWIVRVHGWSRPAARRLVAAVTALPAGMLGAYVLVNVAASGHIVPISGQIKSTFPAVDATPSYLKSYAAYFALLGLGAVGLAVAARGRPGLFGLLLALTVGGAMQGIYILLFTPTAIFWWYFVSMLPAGLLGLAVIIDAVMRSRLARDRPAVFSSAICAAAVLALGAPIVISLLSKSVDGRHLADTGWRVESERAGRWAGQHLPSKAMLSMVNAGAFGYYAPQEVMDLDGVSSSYDYHAALCDGRLLRELHDAHVRYFASHSVDPAYEEQLVSPVPCFPDGASSDLTLDRSREVYRSHPYVHGGRTVVFVIWRLAND